MPDRPNILFVMADQFRADCLGRDPAAPLDEHGDPVVHTPTLNGLADDGTLFTRAYTPNPVCVPARRCLWTGQTAATNGCTGGNSTAPWDFPHTLPGELSDAGYETRLVGKTHSQPMHRGEPRHAEFGFDAMETHVGASVFEDDYSRWLRDRGGDDQRGTGLDHAPGDARPWHRAESEHPTNWTTRRALDFLADRDEDRPFFLALSYVRPHAPLDPPQVYWDEYIDRELPAPAEGDWTGRLAGDIPEATDGIDPERHVHRRRAAYYGLVTHIDHQLHRVLYELQWRHGCRDDTVVVFTADHGELLGDHGRWAKQQPFEGSARVPLVIDPPTAMDTDAQNQIDQPVGLEDLLPTLLDWAGVEIPSTVEGTALGLLMQDPTGIAHRSYYHGETGSPPASHYLVDAETKYVWYPETGAELLFDLASDPQETTDLSRDPAQLETLTRCRDALAERLAGRDEGFVSNGQLDPLPST